MHGKRRVNNNNGYRGNELTRYPRVIDMFLLAMPPSPDVVSTCLVRRRVTRSSVSNLSP